MEKEALETIYDRIYELANRMLRRYNPCKIDHSGICMRTRARKEHHSNCCCEGCKYLSSNGCKVKALPCKLWTCYFVQKDPKNAHLIKRLDLLLRISYKYGLYGFRNEREEIVKIAMSEGY